MKKSKYISLVTNGVVALMLSVVTVNTAQAHVINSAGMCHTKEAIVTGSKTDTNYRGTGARKARDKFIAMKREYKYLKGEYRACVRLYQSRSKGTSTYTVTSRTFKIKEALLNRSGTCNTKRYSVTDSKTRTNYNGSNANKARLMFNAMKQEYKGYTGKDRACVKLKEKWTKGVRKYTVTSRTFQVTKK